jgi:hypothetical protein
MTKKKFKLYTDHIWDHREYIACFGNGYYFDYPFYWGLKSKFTGSPEACDAMQNIMNNESIRNSISRFKTKKQFCKSYREELNRLGEKVK